LSVETGVTRCPHSAGLGFALATAPMISATVVHV
jgi:hypothetical protein